MEAYIRIYAGKLPGDPYKTIKVDEGFCTSLVLERAVNWYIETTSDTAAGSFGIILINSEQQERLLEDFERPLSILQRASGIARLAITRMNRNRSIASERWAVQATLKDSSVVREGYLKKLSKGAYVDRYFKLDTKRLYYSHSSKSITQEFTIIRLETASTAVLDSSRLAFKIETPLKSITLKCNNTEDRLKWVQCILRQCSILKENRVVSELDRKIAQEETNQTRSDTVKCLSCLDFQGIANSSEGRELLYSCLDRTPELEVLRDIEAYRRTPSKHHALELGLGIINSMAKLDAFREIAIALAQTWLKLSSSRQSPPKSLFDDIVNSELTKAEAHFPAVRESPTFWSYLSSMLARQVLREYGS